MRQSLTSLALQNAPALIESVFPVQKVSFEAQRERKAGAGQTLTALGSYWKGRKPLILVRAIVLGSLLPPTGDAEADLKIFEKLMAFDDEGLARRALANNGLKPGEIAARIQIDNPWDFFTCSGGCRMRRAYPAYSENVENVGRISVAHPANHPPGDVSPENLTFPLDVEALGISLRWKREVTDDDKLILYRQVLATFATVTVHSPCITGAGRGAKGRPARRSAIAAQR